MVFLVIYKDHTYVKYGCMVAWYMSVGHIYN